MLRKITFANIGLAGLAVASALATACVADRPARNGVFDENQYLRKDFLITSGNGGVDEGWFVKTTILSTSTPNPLASVSGAGLFAGAEGQTGNFVRFVINQDTMSIVDMRELSNDPTYNSQQQRNPQTLNTWPITNVDLKYQVNLDGEKTNFYQENQELDWQVRQWVKVNFAKNDLADLYAFNQENNPVLQKCIDQINAAVTLHNNSFNVDEANGYFEFALDVTMPIQIPAPTPGSTAGQTDADVCAAAFGASWQSFQALGRQNVTMTIKYAFVRPSKVTDGSYVPMPIGEKDPIQHKYGAFQTTIPYRDPNTGLLGADTYVVRHNPNKDIVYYFAPGMPQAYKDFFSKVLEPQTNQQALSKAGAKGTLKFLNYNDATTLGDGKGPNREIGDPRYSFVEWHSDLDNGSGLLGIAQFFTDPRTGEAISTTVNVFEGPFKDTVEQRLDAFLQTVGAEYLTPSGDFDNNAKLPDGTPAYPSGCTNGQTVPLIPTDVANVLNRQSTVYGKMQQYLQRPFAQYGYQGPSNFVPDHDSGFYDAYFAVAPYQVYADPQANAFVLPEASVFASTSTAQWNSLSKLAQLQALTASIDKGWEPTSYTPQDAVNLANQWQTLGTAATTWEHTQHYLPGMNAADDISMFSYFDIYQRDGRHCVNGQWESRADYTTHLIQSLNEAVATHEFGHTMGLRHNFMGSIDQRNFPVDNNKNVLLYSSSIMDYNQPIVEAFFDTSANTPVWGPYDVAAMAFIYGNDQSASKVVPVHSGAAPGTNVSGQTSPTQPWNDPLGFTGNTERQYLYCSDEHTLYTPLCQQYDMGVTPSEIVANAIQQREWNYLWTNFRLYHKYFSFQNYGTQAITSLQAFRRFQSAWIFDWSQAELTDNLRLINFPIPMGDTAADFYTSLYNKFESDISIANQLAIAYQRAILEQSSGERPYKTVYDPFYGDTTQQGIQIDKVELTTGVTNLWQAGTNFDPSQAAGTFVATLGGLGDPAFRTVSDATLNDFLGAAFATYSYTQLGPLAVFAEATHDPAYTGDLTYQTWVGSWTFDRDEDFLQFVHKLAVDYSFQNCDENGANCQPCVSTSTCTWDPRNRQLKASQLTQSDYTNRFVGPDGKYYIWGFMKSRNQWVLAEKDRNTATYALMYNWQTDVVYGQDTGENGASYLERPVRFSVDSFQYFDDQLPGTTGSGTTATGM